MKDIKKDILWRIYIIYFAVFAFALFILGKVVYIQIFEGEYWRQIAKEQSLDYRSIEAIRGNIFSDDGSLLATSVPIFEVRMDVNSSSIKKEIFYKNVDSLAYCLSELFKDRTEKEYRRLLVNARKSGERYLLVKRNITYPELKVLKTFPIFRLGRYKGGFLVIQKTRREMPYKLLASRTIGFEREGIYVGLEGAYTNEIGGIEGKKLMQKIGPGIWMPLRDDDEVEPQDGCDVVTTIDINLQDVAENALMRQLIEQKAEHGCAVLMEVETGHVKAIANLTRKADGTYDEMFNYAIGESSEPGSTFKLMSVVAALEDGVADIYDHVSTGNGVYKFADRDMIDTHGNGDITLKKAFEVSSNIGISKTIYNGYQKNPQKFIDRLYAMNLNRPLEIEIPGEGMPVVKNTKSRSWSKVSLPWMAIGYEVALTPLQILTFYNAIANNGKMVRPMFVKELSSKGKTIKIFEPHVINPKVCSARTIEKVKLLLEGVVECGTASNLKNTPYKIAGKTGTAHIADKSKGYNKTNYKASFAGFFPADKPRYSCIVVINNPTQGIYFGSAVAAPVFKEIADRVYATRLDIKERNGNNFYEGNPYCSFSKGGNTDDILKVLKFLDYKVENNSTKEFATISANSKSNVVIEEKTIKKNVMPDVRGLGIRDALNIAESLGLKVTVIGRGNVSKQSLLPGISIEKGQAVTLELTNPESVEPFALKLVESPVINDKQANMETITKINKKKIINNKKV